MLHVFAGTLPHTVSVCTVQFPLSLRHAPTLAQLSACHAALASSDRSHAADATAVAPLAVDVARVADAALLAATRVRGEDCRPLLHGRERHQPSIPATAPRDRSHAADATAVASPAVDVARVAGAALLLAVRARGEDLPSSPRARETQTPARDRRRRLPITGGGNCNAGHAPLRVRPFSKSVPACARRAQRARRAAHLSSLVCVACYVCPSTRGAHTQHTPTPAEIQSPKDFPKSQRKKKDRFLTRAPPTTIFLLLLLLLLAVFTIQAHTDDGDTLPQVRSTQSYIFVL
jgi:hypothetical protein